MKRLVLILMVVPLLVGCGGRERRAEKISKETVVKNLYYPDTYESVETVVDSAYVTIYTNRDALGAAYEIIDLEREREQLQMDYTNALSSVSLWKDSWGSFSREQYRQAKEELADAEKKLKNCEADLKRQKTIIRTCYETINEGEFCGWIIAHRYRAENGAGMTRMGDILILTDKDMENVVNVFTIDEFDDHNINKLKDVIDEVLDEEIENDDLKETV